MIYFIFGLLLVVIPSSILLAEKVSENHKEIMKVVLMVSAITVLFIFPWALGVAAVLEALDHPTPTHTPARP